MCQPEPTKNIAPDGVLSVKPDSAGEILKRPVQLEIESLDRMDRMDRMYVN